jgi:glyoxylase-like metal-dependent hydrolase (beta-lactamase superfamily II)
MRITKLEGHNNVYTCNVYLITGDWRRLCDVNTLIDAGSDPSILESIERMNVGVGKRKIEQVILTHSHSDHTAALELIRRAYNPQVFAFSPFMDGVDHILHDGEIIKVGDRFVEIIHTPCHTEDSISLYCKEERVLFVGDSPVIIRSEGGTYEEGFIKTLENLCHRQVETIYFGHGNPMFSDVASQLRESLRNVQASIRPDVKAS